MQMSKNLTNTHILYILYNLQSLARAAQCFCLCMSCTVTTKGLYETAAEYKLHLPCDCSCRAVREAGAGHFPHQ